MENLDFVRAGIFPGTHERFSAMTKLKSRNRSDNLEPIFILKSHKSFQNMVQSYHKKFFSLWSWGEWLMQFPYGTILFCPSALTHAIGAYFSKFPNTA